MSPSEHEAKRGGFLRVGHELVPLGAITCVDLRRLEELEVVVTCGSVERVARGANAIDVVMRLAPAALEGKRLRFLRHAWTMHNLIGHPLLQVCTWLGYSRLGFWLHDHTTPTPRIEGARSPRESAR